MGVLAGRTPQRISLGLRALLGRLLASGLLWFILAVLAMGVLVVRLYPQYIARVKARPIAEPTTATVTPAVPVPVAPAKQVVPLASMASDVDPVFLPGGLPSVGVSTADRGGWTPLAHWSGVRIDPVVYPGTSEGDAYAAYRWLENPNHVREVRWPDIVFVINYGEGKPAGTPYLMPLHEVTGEEKTYYPVKEQEEMLMAGPANRDKWIATKDIKVFYRREVLLGHQVPIYRVIFRGLKPGKYLLWVVSVSGEEVVLPCVAFNVLPSR